MFSCLVSHLGSFVHSQEVHFTSSPFETFRFFMGLTQMLDLTFTGTLLSCLNISGGVKAAGEASGALGSPGGRGRRPYAVTALVVKDSSGDLHDTGAPCMQLCHTESLIYRLKALRSAKRDGNYSLGDAATALLPYFLHN